MTIQMIELLSSIFLIPTGIGAVNAVQGASSNF